jgi:hypothetical protein
MKTFNPELFNAYPQFQQQLTALQTNLKSKADQSTTNRDELFATKRIGEALSKLNVPFVKGGEIVEGIAVELSIPSQKLILDYPSRRQSV